MLLILKTLEHEQRYLIQFSTTEVYNKRPTMFKDESNEYPQKDILWFCIQDYPLHIIKHDDITTRRVISLVLSIEMIHCPEGRFIRIVNLDDTLHEQSFHCIIN